MDAVGAALADRPGGQGSAARSGRGTATLEVAVYQPSDPAGHIPGGIDSFLRDLIRFAPADFRFRIIGITTDPVQRPVGRWSTCEIGGRSFDFYPVLHERHAERQARIPLSLRYVIAARWHWATIGQVGDVIDTHRVEPLLMLAGRRQPKHLYVHTDPRNVTLAKSSIRWRFAPWLYRAIETRAYGDVSAVHCMSSAAVQTVRERLSRPATTVDFLPTWVDRTRFHPLADHLSLAAERARLSPALAQAGLELVLYVGRLESEKDPGLLLDAFARVAAQRPSCKLVYVGHGSLGESLQQQVRERGLADRVILAGAQPSQVVAAWMRVATVFALPSLYEGMPIAMLEAMASGVPAVATDVGEVRRLVTPGHNGEIVDPRTPENFAASLARALDHAPRYRGAACVEVAARFGPAVTLAPVFERYRSLALEADEAAT